jgi:hypothetical protein
LAEPCTKITDTFDAFKLAIWTTRNVGSPFEELRYSARLEGRTQNYILGDWLLSPSRFSIEVPCFTYENVMH